MDSRYKGHAAASGLLLGIALLPVALTLGVGPVPPSSELFGLLAASGALLFLAGWSWRTRFASPGEDPSSFYTRFAVLRSLFGAVVLAGGAYLLWFGNWVGALVLLWGLHRIRSWNAAADELRSDLEQEKPD